MPADLYAGLVLDTWTSVVDALMEPISTPPWMKDEETENDEENDDNDEFEKNNIKENIQEDIIEQERKHFSHYFMNKSNNLHSYIRFHYNILQYCTPV